MTPISTTNPQDYHLTSVSNIVPGSLPRRVPPRLQEPRTWRQVLRNNIFRAIAGAICFIIMVAGSFFAAEFVANVLRKHMYEVLPDLPSTNSSSSPSIPAPRNSVLTVAVTEVAGVHVLSTKGVVSHQSTLLTMTRDVASIRSSATPSLIKCPFGDDHVC
ncbi:hypothetical protein T440DRAFT_130963 [Plenodomus tracheiphilus IPT5]|uniref:Uncharacterized protein n=1 Tax=Plenodomus tracheiphilus IPT5 TaxID=1408161 RepID=A0A6A7B2H5_9PLEO|nr:hypothetical protein T440DRAFT_130963 [Plenodomus tracheiphilus IPT5]